jgi:hypothetical protein
MLLFEVLEAVGSLPAEVMPATHRHLMIVLANFGESIYPSVATLAQRTGLARSTVKKCLAELERAGWITRRARLTGLGQASNEYDVHTTGGPITGQGSAVDQGPITGSADSRPGVAEKPTPGRLPAYPRPITGPKLPIELPTELPDTPHSAGAREEPAEVPGGASVVDHEGNPVELPAAPAPSAPPAPADLVALLAELAAEGHAYGTDVAAQLAQGRRLTHGQRVKLRHIHAEREAREREATAPRPRAPPRQASPAVQRPAAAGERTWTIGEEI